MLHKNIFLLLGSNSGDRPRLLQMATECMREVGSIVVKSKIYETAPWGKTNQPHFLNQAIELESWLSPKELLVKIQLIEQTLGRTRLEKWGERSIDIDIIYFGETIIDGSDLIIPHPRLAERKFVLVPLVEISPKFVHPILQKSNAELLKECSDILEVKGFIN